MLALILLLAIACSVYGLEDAISSRIIGGVEVPGQSWMTALRIDGGSVFCGATLIDPTHLLTAAHCVTEQVKINAAFRQGRVEAYIGGTNIDNRDEFEVATVISGVWHPDADLATYDYDVAVLKLERPITNRTPVQMATAENSALETDGTIASVIGWGTTSTGSSSSAGILRGIEVPIISNNWCERSYRNVVEERMFCAGIYFGGGKDSCWGDSGGPIIVDNVQIGITSFGSGCAESEKPGVYARLSAYTSFIQAAMNDESLEAFSSGDRADSETTAFTADTSSDSNEMLIIGAAAGGAVVVSSMLLGAYFYRRKRITDQHNREVAAVGASTQPSAMNEIECVDVDIVTGQAVNGQRAHIVGDGGV